MASAASVTLPLAALDSSTCAQHLSLASTENFHAPLPSIDSIPQCAVCLHSTPEFGVRRACSMQQPESDQQNTYVVVRDGWKRSDLSCLTN